jgi:hypothetical protein
MRDHLLRSEPRRSSRRRLNHEAGIKPETVQAEWRDNGVRYVVLANLSLGQRSLRKGLAAVRAFNKVVKALRKF